MSRELLPERELVENRQFVGKLVARGSWVSRWAI
jgi:hypothetical protein